MTLQELNEAIQRKRLEEELAKKANKKTRDFDESMLAFCQTCFVPIYVSEPLYNQNGEQIIDLYTGTGAVAYSEGIGVGGYQARNERYKTTEKWIQCGYCYAEFRKEKERLDKYCKEMENWGLASVILCFISLAIFIGFYVFQNWEWIKKSIWLYIVILLIELGFFGTLLWGVLWMLGKFFYRLTKGSSPPEPDRFRVRKNPYRQSLIWKLDNEGKSVKEDSTKT